LHAPDRDSGMNYWPGFVDVLSSFILGIIFLLTVFVFVQFYLTQEVTGKDTALNRLNAQIAQLTELLSLEKTGKLGLEEQLSMLRSSLTAAEGERDRYKGLYDGVGGGAGAQGKAAELSGQLDAERRLSSRALAQVEVLNQQIAALRRQLAALEEALDASEKRDKESQSRIADLGQRLNVALAQRVQELSRYRSDFFGGCGHSRQSARHPHRRRPLRVPVGSVLRHRQGHSTSPRAAPSSTGSPAALLELGKEDSGRDRLGAARRRPYRRAADQQPAVQEQLGAFGRARDLGRAISHRQGRVAAAAGGRRLRRVPADRYRQDRGAFSRNRRIELKLTER
jgi:Chromosome segregation ATPases